MNIPKYKVVVRFNDKSQKTYRIETKEELDKKIKSLERSTAVKSYSVYKQGEFLITGDD